MAAVSWGEIIPASAARELSGVYASGTEYALHAAIASAVNTAITTGLTTTTVACSSYTQSQIQNQMNLLQGMGYTAAYSGTTLTVTW
jgi:hypothetical protein